MAWRIPWTVAGSLHLYLWLYGGLSPTRLYSPWGCKQSDTTEQLSLHFTSYCLWSKSLSADPSLVYAQEAFAELLKTMTPWVPCSHSPHPPPPPHPPQRPIKTESLGLGPGPGCFLENDSVDAKLQSGLRTLGRLLLKRGVLLPL